MASDTVFMTAPLFEEKTPANILVTPTGGGTQVSLATIAQQAASGGAGNWTAPVVSTIGSGISVNSGTISATGGGNWSATAVNTIGSGITISAGTISAAAGGGNWSATAVSAIGSGITINSGTISATGSGATVASGTIVTGGSLDLILSNGTTIAVVGSLTGPQGSTGSTGAQGVSVNSGTIVNGNTLDLVLSNGTTIATGALSVGYSAMPAEVQSFLAQVTLPGTPSPNIKCMIMPIVQNTQVPANFGSSTGYCYTLATANSVYTVAYLRSGTTTTIGTITFGSGSHVPTFSTQAAVSLVSGDVVTVTSPGTADLTLADVGITLALLKQ